MNDQREILFRGKRVDTGEWEEGFFGRITSLDALIIKAPYPTMQGELSCLDFWEVIPATVGQYTGLNDATKWEDLTESERQKWLEKHTMEEWKGKPIFEGDIVKIPLFEPSIMAIGFIEGAFCLVNKNGEFVADIHYTHHAGVNDTEVIGNIHDNPELLEDKR